MKFKTKLHHFSIDVCCSAVIGWQTGAGLWLVVSSSRVNGHGSSRGRLEREREPQPAAAALWRGLSLYLWLSSPHKMPTFAHCATSDHQDLVSPTSARGWLAEGPCVAPRAPEQLQVSRVRTRLGRPLWDLGRNFSVSSRLFSIDVSKMGILANFAWVIAWHGSQEYLCQYQIF